MVRVGVNFGWLMLSRDARGALYVQIPPVLRTDARMLWGMVPAGLPERHGEAADTAGRAGVSEQSRCS